MSFATFRDVKITRKPHQCSGCRGVIPKGGPCLRWAAMIDGEFMTSDYHIDCRAAEERLNDLHDTYGSEWISLADIESDDYAFIIEEFPMVADRMGIKT